MDPFGQAFDEKMFYPSTVHVEALARLDYAVRSRVPFAVLTGEVGCGKTLVWKMLVRRMPRERYAFATFPSPPRGPEELIRSLLRTLGRLPEAGGSWRPLENALSSLERTRRTLVLVLDEAQELSNDSLLELRSMTNLSPGALTVLLVGQPELRARLKELAPVDSRVGLRYHLCCLPSDEVAGYLRHKLSAAGTPAEFADSTCAALAAACAGSPREIDHLSALALARAVAHRRTAVLREDVDAVATDSARQAG